MSIVYGQPITVRLQNDYVDFDYWAEQQGARFARLDDTHMVVLSYLGPQDRYRLAVIDTAGTIVASHLWDPATLPYPTTQVPPFGAAYAAVLPVADGKVIFFYRQQVATSGQYVSAWVIDWSTYAEPPTIGTAWTSTGAPGPEYYPVAASATHLLLHRRTWGGASYITPTWESLQISGTTLSAGGTTGASGTWLAYNQMGKDLGSGYFVMAGTAAAGRLLELVQLSGATVTRHSTVTVTEAASGGWYGSAVNGAHNPDSFGIFSPDFDHSALCIPSRSGTTPTYTLLDLGTAPWNGPCGGIQVGGMHVTLGDEIDSVFNGEDPPVADYLQGNLYAMSVSATETVVRNPVNFAQSRQQGSWQAVKLTSTLGYLCWASADLFYDGGGDTTLNLLPVQEYLDTTGADDVTSIMSNYLGGAVLQRYLIDNPSYLALLTASPTALGTMTSEVVGGDYERVLCSWSAPGTKTIGLNALSIPNMPAVTVSWLAFMDAPTGGNMLFAKQLPAPVVVTASSEWRMAANTVVITL
jgi:hypothetical protein